MGFLDTLKKGASTVKDLAAKAGIKDAASAEKKLNEVKSAIDSVKKK